MWKGFQEPTPPKRWTASLTDSNGTEVSIKPAFLDEPESVWYVVVLMNLVSMLITGTVEKRERWKTQKQKENDKDCCDGNVVLCRVPVFGNKVHREGKFIWWEFKLAFQIIFPKMPMVIRFCLLLLTMCYLRKPSLTRNKIKLFHMENYFLLNFQIIMVNLPKFYRGHGRGIYLYSYN